VSPAIREGIFERFFTAKPVGEGAGFGLAMPYGAVRDAGGALSVVADTPRALLRIDLPESVEVTEAAHQSGTNP
jgi:C4-dicarboxylate-specific signal transduction histidine kinase